MSSSIVELLTPDELAAILSPDEIEGFLEVERRRQDPFHALYPTTGPLSVDQYWWALAFWVAGHRFRERACVAANQIGKTTMIGYEVTCHLTGRYPAWWPGVRFDRATEWWVAGDTMQTTRDILQTVLLGRTEGLETRDFTGLLPAHTVVDFTRRSGGVSHCVDKVWVQHVSGGLSVIEFKSYDQGRRTFQGVPVRGGIWLDEEPPDPVQGQTQEVTSDIYTECLMRTVATDGMVLSSFTPLRGLTPWLKTYLETSVLATRDGDEVPGMALLPGGDDEADLEAHPSTAGPPPSRFLVGATWDDAPHLSASAKATLWASIPPYQRDARTKGIPQLGAGAIYPVEESLITVDDFEVPRHWPRGFALDTGWNWTAAVWVGLDREADTLYLTDCYKRGQAEPPVHAEAIKARGTWMPGVGDCADINKYDGQQFLQIYRQLGLTLELADKAVEAGIQDVYMRLSTGRLKVFKRRCAKWFQEFRLYRRDEKGRIVKQHDHLMDGTRYRVRAPLRKLITEPAPKRPADPLDRLTRGVGGGGSPDGWQGA